MINFKDSLICRLIVLIKFIRFELYCSCIILARRKKGARDRKRPESTRNRYNKKKKKAKTHADRKTDSTDSEFDVDSKPV